MKYERERHPFRLLAKWRDVPPRQVAEVGPQRRSSGRQSGQDADQVDVGISAYFFSVKPSDTVRKNALKVVVSKAFLDSSSADVVPWAEKELERWTQKK